MGRRVAGRQRGVGTANGRRGGIFRISLAVFSQAACETAIERGETTLEVQLADLEETLTTLTEATAPWREAAAEAAGQGA